MLHSDNVERLGADLVRGRLSRRAFMKRAAALGLSSAAIGDLMRQAAAQEEEPVYGGTFTFGTSREQITVANPLKTVSVEWSGLTEALFLRLVYGRQWGDGMNPQPEGPLELGVAETMTEIEPDQAWEFTLRQNVLWHDGAPVTADDVIFGIWLSLNKNAEPLHSKPLSFILGGERLTTEGAPQGTVEVEGATKLGDYAVRIALDRPVANYWKSWSVGYFPMPKHILGELPLEAIFAEPYATMPIGNGPFKAVQYVEGQYMELAANEDFYLGRPYVDRLIVRFGDSDTRTAALEAQEIDGSGVTIGPVFDRLTSLPYLDGNAVPRDHPDGFIVNFDRFPEHGAALNKAIMHTIDVETISQQLNSGTLRPSNYLFEHVVGYEAPPDGFVSYPYDPEQARAILEEANWDFNRELEWLFDSPPDPEHDAMQQMLAEAGIRTTYRIIDPAAQEEVRDVNADFDLHVVNFGPSQLFEENWKFFRCGWTRAEGGRNLSRYCNEEVDALFVQGLAERDAGQQKALFDQAILLLNQVPPQATLWRQSIGYGWNTRVRGAYPIQYNLPVRPAFERVWLAPE